MWGGFGRSTLLLQPRSLQVIQGSTFYLEPEIKDDQRARADTKIEEKCSPGPTWEGGRISQSLAGVYLIGLAHCMCLSNLFSVDVSVFMVFQLSFFF